MRSEPAGHLPTAGGCGPGSDEASTGESRQGVRAGLPLAAVLAGALAVGACVLAVGACARVTSGPEHDSSVPPVHRVEPGETLCSLGGRHGLSATALRESNGIEIGLTEPLPTGISLRLEGAPATYTVRRGDTLSEIALWSGTETGALARHNGMSDPDFLLEGQVLRIPAGAATVCAPIPRRASPRTPKAAELREPSPTPPLRPSVQQGVVEIAVTRPEIGEEEALLARAEERYAEADYDGCVRAAALARNRLAPQSESPEARRLAARAAAMEGLAYAARENNEQAVAAFRTAFALDPDFELEAQYASPKILPLLREAREPGAVP
jgi:LysM repeat protein